MTIELNITAAPNACEAEWIESLYAAVKKAGLNNITTLKVNRKSKSFGSSSIRSAFVQFNTIENKGILWVNLAKLSRHDAEGNYHPEYDMIPAILEYAARPKSQEFLAKWWNKVGMRCVNGVVFKV